MPAVPGIDGNGLLSVASSTSPSVCPPNGRRPATIS